jgi:hypothetical protein
MDAPTPPYAPASDDPDRDSLPPEVAALLDFTPVPRQLDRPNGWTGARQRRFIVLLAQHGSPKRAAAAMRKHMSGLRNLYRDDEEGGFRAAWHAALEIAERRGAGGTRDWAVPPNSLDDAPGSRRPGGWSDAEGWADADQDGTEEEKLKLVEHLFHKWLGKVEQERKARLKGEVVAADFYLRQITFFEVAFDLMAEGIGMDAFTLMSQFRRGDEPITRIAATPFSQILDAKRRELWAKMGEPDRPEYPPARYLVTKPGFLLQSEYQALSEEDKKLPPRDQQHCLKALWAEEAEAQAAWEAAAHSAEAQAEWESTQRREQDE